MSTVADIIDGVKHRLPERANIYPVINNAVRMINKRLRVHEVSMIRGSLSVSFSADSSSASLPSDYWGLIEKPYINGKTYALEPVPDQSTKLRYTSNSTPSYYEVVGTSLYLYPGTSSAITINGAYWTQPTTLTKPTDTMPYSELFDEVIQEALMKIYKTGRTSGDPNEIGLLRELVREAVDDIAPRLDKAAPKKVPDNMGLDCLTNEDW